MVSHSLKFVPELWTLDHFMDALLPHLKGQSNPCIFWSQSQPLGTPPVQVYLVGSHPVPLVPLSTTATTTLLYAALILTFHNKYLKLICIIPVLFK